MRVSTSIRLLLIALGLSVAGWFPQASFATPKLVGSPSALRAQAKARSRLIRTAIKQHRELRAAKISLPLPPSDVVTAEKAKNSLYGDSWSCRESSRLLRSSLASNHQLSLNLDSSGPNAFLWGNEGYVSYHYYLVDNLEQPRVLIDPTGSSNFHRDAAPDGMLHSLLLQVGQEQHLTKAAQRVAQRIAGGSPNSLLVLANSAEIKVYKEALDRAAQLRADMMRNAQLQNQ